MTKSFSDGAVSGGLLERPGVQKLLEFLATQSEPYIVLADDISRFARDNLVFALLKKTFSDLNSQMQTVNLHMEDSPEGDLIQAIMSSAAAYERQKNRLQVIARIKARMELGYWVFQTPPLGYRYQFIKGHGKVPTPDGRNSEVVRKTLETVALGKLITQSEIADFITKQGLLDYKGQPKRATLNLTRRILDNAWFYAGFMEYQPWNITRRKGQHTAIISIETYEQVISSLSMRSRKLNRVFTKQKFPLRGMITCDGCNRSMYCSYAGGRNSRYGYYYCKDKSCQRPPANIRRETIHNTFEEHLSTLIPSYDTLIEKEQDLLSEWEKRDTTHAERQNVAQKRLNEVEQKINGVIDSAGKAESESVQKAFFRRIEALELQKARIADELAQLENPTSSSFPSDLERVCDFFRNLPENWKNAGYEGKRAILNGLFHHKLHLTVKNTFRNPETPLLDWLTTGYSASKTFLVERRLFN